MALAEVAAATQTCTVGTEHTLATSTTGKTYVLVLDLTNAVNGDVFEARIKTKPLSGSSSTLAYYRPFAHAQGEPVKYSVPVPANRELVATLKQTEGTSRNVPWALLSID